MTVYDFQFSVFADYITPFFGVHNHILWSPVVNITSLYVTQAGGFTVQIVDPGHHPVKDPLDMGCLMMVKACHTACSATHEGIRD